MFKDCVCILDVGSSSITALVGEKSINNTFAFRAEESIDHYPFYKCVFTDVQVLEEEIGKLISNLKKNHDIGFIDRIFVGVPGEFIKVLCKNRMVSYSKAKKINEDDIAKLFEINRESVDSEHVLIHNSASFFVVGNVKVYNPIGHLSINLGGKLSYVYVSEYFKSIFDNILYKLGVKVVKYISTDYAEANYLFSGENQNSTRTLIDCGFSTTSVTISQGKGLICSGAFPFGGGIISGKLCEELDCDFAVADYLRKKMNLGLVASERDVYSITYEDKLYEFNIAQCNEVVTSVLDEIAENIYNVVKSCEIKVDLDTETYFTGGGICFLRGAVEYVASKIRSMPNTIAPRIPRYNKESFSSKISLLATALENKNSKIFFID